LKEVGSGALEDLNDFLDVEGWFWMNWEPSIEDFLCLWDVPSAEEPRF
jgi:hypothetical protein